MLDAARAGAAAGIAGPTAFTGAWLVSSLRQSPHPAAAIQISGLAAPDARDPWIMVAGFVVLGGCTVAFGGALRDALGGRGGVGQGRRHGGVGQGRRHGGRAAAGRRHHPAGRSCRRRRAAAQDSGEVRLAVTAGDRAGRSS